MNKDTIEEIRSRNDIVDIIGAYVPLKRAGNRFKGHCPFHKEKTPSFNVNPDRQSYYCFGCQRGGDVFSFLMEHDGMDFMSATRALADRAGVIIDETERSSGRKGPDKSKLYKILSQCSAFFHQTLSNAPEAQAARDYLDQRHLDPAIARQWEIGFHPSTPNGLREWAKKKDISEHDLSVTGMLAASNDPGRGNALYERFRGRLLFPIRDELSRVVGFSGRTMDPRAKGAKYVNTPETALFKKSRILFGFDQARKPMHDAGWALLSEGQIDVIRCHASGFTQTVAPQGTSLTEDHVRILRRHVDRLKITFDGDSAGVKAAIRAAGMLQAEEISVDILSMPKGEDPDSILQSGGADAFDELIHEAKPAILFYAATFKNTGDLDDPSRQGHAIKQLLEFIQTSPSAVQRESMVQQLAEYTGLTEKALKSDLNRRSNRRTTAIPRKQPEHEDPAEAPMPRQERDLLGILIDAPGLNDLIFQFIRSEHLVHPLSRKLLEQARNLPEITIEDLRSEADGDTELIQLIAALEMDSKNHTYLDFSAEDVLKQLIIRLRTDHLKTQRKNIKARIENATPEELEDLRFESKQITLDLGVLRRGWEQASSIMS